MGTTDDGENGDEFPPKKRFDEPNHRLIGAGIATILDMEALQECGALITKSTVAVFPDQTDDS